MAYEKSAVAETTSALPQQSAPIMREDREINPYQRRAPKPGSGQIPITSEAKGESLEEPKSTTEETVHLSPQVAALARKEQRFRREEQALKERVRTLDAEKAEIAELKALKTKLEAKDFSGIEDLVKYDDYTKYLIEKESNLSPEQQALKALASEVDGLKKSQKEDVEKRFESAVQDRRKAVTALVETDEAYSSIKELKMQEAVVQHILDTWEHDSIDLSPEEAAREVEQELIDRAGKWSALSKLKAKVEPTADEKKQLPPLKPQIKTLTNNMAATGEVKRPVKSFQFMSDTERYAEARRRAEERLKQKVGN